MAQIGFIGLGKMGEPMAQSLLNVGHAVTGYDINTAARDKFGSAGGVVATAVDVACAGADVVITMLPGGREVRDVYLQRGGILASAPNGALLIDASTVDIETARAVAAAAHVNELAMVDAPASGDVAAAETGALRFLVGGSEHAFERARPLLEAMGNVVVHVGEAGTGQAAKLCNNMILGISTIAVSEAFLLAEKLGIDPPKLFEIASQGAGQCWALTHHCPVPDLSSSGSANRGCEAAVSAATMLKDLKLAQEAARLVGAQAPMAAGAAALYGLYVDQGSAGKDISGIIRLLRGA